MALVRATENGYDGIAVRKKGEKFQWNGKLAKWMEPVGSKEKAAEEEDEVGTDADEAGETVVSDGPHEVPPNAKPAKRDAKKSKNGSK